MRSRSFYVNTFYAVSFGETSAISLQNKAVKIESDIQEKPYITNLEAY